MTIDESTIGFTRYGSGPEYVLVMHDWNCDHTVYDNLLAYLDGATFSYVFVDLRGYGRSRTITGTYTVGEIASDCLKVADRLGWRRFHLLAHSMTGMAAQRMAADAPLRIKSVVATCPISAAGSKLDGAGFEFFASTTENDDNFRRLMHYVTGQRFSPQWAEHKLLQNRNQVSAQCRLGYLGMFSTSEFVDDVRGLETPFLVVVGDSDPGIDEAAMRQTFLLWHPNAELVVISNCGHYPMEECPPYFATVVENYFRRQTG